MMIIQCENCQKKYKLDPAKIKRDVVSFSCKQCGKKVTFSNMPAAAPPKPAKPAPEPDAAPAVAQSSDIRPAPEPNPDPEREPSTPTEATVSLKDKTLSESTRAAATVTGQASGRRFGLNAKMLLLFFLIPVCLVVAASGLYLWQLDTLTSKISNDSHSIVERLSHELVNDTARMVANQCKLYLDAKPYLTREEFNQDPEFRELALQKVGETGYTCIYAIPDSDGRSGVWVHPNDRIIGLDLPPAMKKALGPQYQAWLNIYKGAYNGKPSSGYYKWKDKDGSVRDKYMTCQPVPGTDYVVAATTYVDEINRDVNLLKYTAHQMTHKTKMIVMGVFAVTLMMMGSIVLFYSRKLKANLTALIDAAEKISVGDLDTEINVDTKDEISDLAETISRMQESIRLSIERLRRRR
jgi:HAMP domain-containing protein